MRRFTLFLLLIMLATTSCSKLSGSDQMTPADLVPLADIPASYGELVTVTFAPQRNDEFGWREMWFENEDTGTITYVPVLLPDWKYYPKMVRTVERP